MNTLPFGFRFIQNFIFKLTRLYFSANIKGLENIPKGPCLLVGNHNAISVVSPEIWIFGSNYFLEHKKLRVLGHDIVLKIPILAGFARKYLFYVPNNLESAKSELERGYHVLVFPGGAWESCRPSAQKDQIDFKNRTGFIRLARIAKVPIVPIVSVGAHDGLYVWKRGERIAKLLRFDKIFRVDTFPIGLSFPFIFHLGPFFPFIPLPKKVTMEVLPPIETDKLSENDSEAAMQVISKMQSCITEVRNKMSL